MTASSSKGLVGEREVNQGLYLKLDKSVYTNHSDVTLPLEDGGTTQVDHIVNGHSGFGEIASQIHSG